MFTARVFLSDREFDVIKRLYKTSIVYVVNRLSMNLETQIVNTRMS